MYKKLRPLQLRFFNFKPLYVMYPKKVTIDLSVQGRKLLNKKTLTLSLNCRDSELEEAIYNIIPSSLVKEIKEVKINPYGCMIREGAIFKVVCDIDQEVYYCECTQVMDDIGTFKVYVFNIDNEITFKFDTLCGKFNHILFCLKFIEEEEEKKLAMKTIEEYKENFGNHIIEKLSKKSKSYNIKTLLNINRVLKDGSK